MKLSNVIKVINEHEVKWNH